MPALVHAAAIEQRSEPTQRNFSRHFLLLARDRMGEALRLTIGLTPLFPGEKDRSLS
jgi:hypothetical protein